MMQTNSNSILTPDFSFADLSLKDLLDAREMFHVHLMNKKNVVATAVGLYRIRKKEPWPNTRPYGEYVKQKRKPKRTLFSSEVREYSWPCILVFVKEWIYEDDYKKMENYTDIIPPRIYLPDGRIVPICVVEATKNDYVEDTAEPSSIIFPGNFVGGGFPLVIESQGVQRVASIGCVVYDGNKYYTLTNKHVTGEPGTVIYTRMKGVLTRIGKSASKQIGTLEFSKVYPGWASSNLFINTDVGLIEIDDINIWKTDVFQVGTYSKLADINTHNLSLKLIGAQVTAYGSVSGRLKGEVAAMFYRYKSVGGYEYAADFLIGPRDNELLKTKKGDSGTLWMLEAEDEDTKKKDFLPIALQWGSHSFTDSRQTGAYALATCLSNVLRNLEVDLVRDWNVDSDYSWGKLGHFSIATLACSLVKDRKLKELIKNNLKLITFDYDNLTISKIDKGLGLLKEQFGFVPLADVPDLVWKGRVAGIKRGKESPNHFADMDKKDSYGKTLLEWSTGTYKNIAFLTPDEWLEYYNDDAVKDKSKGILPFRVWQFFVNMVDFLEKGKVTEFVTAAGILSHYVGDACQPLHISHMFDGKPTAQGVKGKGVHSVYETNMINKFIPDILKNAGDKVKNNRKALINIRSGKEAGGATVELIKKTFATIKPEELVNICEKHKDLGKAAIAEKMWEKVGEGTTGSIFFNGAFYLASLWESAWKVGKGSTHITDLDEVDKDKVVALYESKDFVPSVNITEIGALLT
ncbi:MAG: hypothetical protein V4685_07370 [Bacteroidota bacterium]